MTAWAISCGRVTFSWPGMTIVTPAGPVSTVTRALGTTPASLSREIRSMSPWTCSVSWRTTTATGAPDGNSVSRTRLASSAPDSGPTPRSSSPGIGLPNGEVVGLFSTLTRRRSTSSLITCSQRHASACTSSQGSRMTSTSSRSASRCLRITATASARPLSVSSRWRSPATCSSPSRSIRDTVWLTVGPL
ncbi:IdeR [Mycobacterium avium subsp. paratuberculosis K-10]|uniref:IdeR n=1 Tax=Mycolicibacterium paratuberculosis (strain ATCC BAA-968 / K-10) TaxID=262316 RepID=Q73W33_MYCPA|nr:IdeR [Mycobacterium avium subsp. paratuberculosis K-10]